MKTKILYAILCIVMVGVTIGLHTYIRSTQKLTIEADISKRVSIKDQQDNTKVYKNSGLNFEVVIPSTWNVTTQKDNSIAFRDDQAAKKLFMEYHRVYGQGEAVKSEELTAFVARKTVMNIVTFENTTAFIAAWSTGDDCKSFLACLSTGLVSPEKISITGATEAYHAYSDPVDGYGANEYVLVGKDGRVYIISITELVDTDNTDVMKTFKLTK